MQKKYGLYVFLILFFIAGTGIGILNYFYPFSFINNILFKYNYSLDPSVEIDPEKNYEIEFWYPPIFRTIPSIYEEEQAKELEKRMKNIKMKIKDDYPNIDLKLVEVSFLEWKDKLNESFDTGNPPDILFSIDYDHYLNEKYQIPVERYIQKNERKNYFTIDWKDIEKRGGHLWIIPVSYQEQAWLSHDGFTFKKSEIDKFISYENFSEGKIAFYYESELLLRQLFNFKRSNSAYNSNEGLTANSVDNLNYIFNWLKSLQNEGIIFDNQSNAISSFQKGEVEVLAPVNPWLEYYMQNKITKVEKIMLKNQIRTLGLNIFQNKKETNSYRVKAVMETAKIIAEELRDDLYNDLNLIPAFQTQKESSTEQYVEIFQLSPGDDKRWEEVITLWRKFWENN